MIRLSLGLSAVLAIPLGAQSAPGGIFDVIPEASALTVATGTQGLASSAATIILAPPQDARGRPAPGWAFGGGLRFFSVIGASGAVQAGRVQGNGRGNTRGFVVSAELGQGGQEYFLGYRRAGPLLNAVSFGAAYIRTDDDAHGVAGDQSYVGPEFRLTFLGVGFSLGQYWRTSGSAPGDGSFFDAALMLGVW